MQVTTTSTAPPESQIEAITITDTECQSLSPDFCIEIPAPEPLAGERVDRCATAGEHTPTGATLIVPAPSSAADGSLRIQIEVEAGLAVDGGCFASEVLEILNDVRGWGDVYATGFSQVDDGTHDLALVLASPTTTDALCYPARTAGIYSCRRGNHVVINLMRWESGTDEYSQDLTTYRRYLINHEVGHFLGRGHERCPGSGEPAPVMMQQTKGLDGCLPNGWPTESER